MAIKIDETALMVARGSICALYVLSMSENLPGVLVARPISNKNGANTNGKKKQAEVSIEKSAAKGYLNVAHGSFSYTPIIDKIDKRESKILDVKLTFVDDDGNPLVPIGNVDSDSEVEVMFDETANLMATTSFNCRNDRGYGTNNLLEQRRETK
nr:hypothetical protein [Tanacetum cinerariifolium]